MLRAPTRQHRPVDTHIAWTKNKKAANSEDEEEKNMTKHNNHNRARKKIANDMRFTFIHSANGCGFDASQFGFVFFFDKTV